MNVMRRKIISLNLAIIMVLSLLPFGITPAKAADDIGYATFFQNKDDSTGTKVQYDNFLASNCNLKIYDALKNHISTKEGSVLTGFSGDADGQQRYRFYDIIKDVFSTDSSNPGVVYGQWTNVTGNYALYRSTDQTADGKDYILNDGLGDQVTLLDETAFQYADGDVVVAWESEDDLIYAPGSTLSISGGVELEAILGANYITFYDGDDPSFKYYRDPDSILASGMRLPSKSGYVFTGWNSEQGGTGDWYCPGSNIQGVPHSLYAQFSILPDEDHVIVICDTGLENGKYADVLTLAEGNTVILPGHADDNSTVAYWVGRTEKGEIFYPAGEAVTVESGLALEAVVVREDSYYGVVDGDGGLTSEGSPYFATSCYITSAGNLNIYSFNDFTTFEKENSVLMGYTGQKTGKTYSFNDDIWAAMGQEAGDSNIARFTATYSETEGGYIQYMGNGAYTPVSESYYLQSGLDFSNLGEKVIMENQFTPPPDQYFLGWNTAQNGTGDWYMSGDEINFTESTVLYAQWGISRVTYHYTDEQGFEKSITEIDEDMISNAMTTTGSTDEVLPWFAFDYGLIDDLDVDMDEYVTRIDMCRLVARLMDLNLEAYKDVTLPFTDVDDLTADELLAAKGLYSEGITIGTSPTTLSPRQIITRAQVVSFIYIALGFSYVTEEGYSPFDDVDESRWYYPCVISLWEKNIIIRDENVFEPHEAATWQTLLRWTVGAYEYKTFGEVENTEIIKEAEDSTSFFEGWNERGGGSGDWYCPYDPILPGTSVDLYEVWVEAPQNYHYVLTGARQQNGKFTQFIEMTEMSETITLPTLSDYYGWSSEDAEAGTEGFLDVQDDEVFGPGESVDVRSGDVFQPLSGNNTTYIVYNENNSNDRSRTYYCLSTNASLTVYGVTDVFGNTPSGVSFKSWNTSVSGAGRDYPEGSQVRNSVNLFAQWESLGGGSSGGGGSAGGSGSDSSVSNTVVGNGENVGIHPTGSSVSASQMSNAVNRADEGSTIAVEATSSSSVSLPVTGMANAANNSNELLLNLRYGDIVLTAQVIADLTDGTTSSSKVEVSITKQNSSRDETISALLNTGAVVFDVSVYVGNKSIHSFNDDLTLSFTVPNLVNIEDPHVLHILSDGTKEYYQPDSISGDTITVKGIRNLSTFAVIPGSEVPEEQTNPFSDVNPDSYYYDAVLWAVENGVTNGTGANTFSPDIAVSRAQMVTFLWRANGSPEATGANPFTDVDEDDYYYDAVLWAVGNGVTIGTSAETFSPDAVVTRAQAVTFQWRVAGSPVVSGSSFDDVAADAYYVNAVTWAVANGITNGTGGNNFSPDASVSRAQAVTFLYRERA